MNQGRGNRNRQEAGAVAGTLLFAVSPQWWFPSAGDQDLHWAWWEQLAGSSYVILAVTVLLAAALAGRRTRPAAREPAAGEPALAQPALGGQATVSR